MDFAKGTGLEFIGRAMVLQLAASLNTEIAVQASVWAPLDVAFASTLGTPTGSTILHPIVEFHMGHIPELIDADVTRYPNLCVMGIQAQPQDGSDQSEEFMDTMVIEVMTRSDPYVDHVGGNDAGAQELVNRRTLRTAEAVNNILMRDPTVGGVLDSYRGGLRLNSINISDVFIRRRHKGREESFYWQGARIEYSCRKPASYLDT